MARPSRRRSRLTVALAASLLLAIAVAAPALGASQRFASPAAARSARQGSGGCERRAGTVWLENQRTRVYSHRGRVYACGRPSGASVYLFSTRNSGLPYRLKLAGAFVVWEQTTFLQQGNVAVERLVALNIATRKMRRFGAFQTSGHSIGPSIVDFLASPDGTVIWLENKGLAVGEGGPYLYSAESWLRESSGRRETVLDYEVNRAPMYPPASGGPPSARYPISSFGLSNNSHVVYWTDNGHVKSAAVR